MQTLLVIKGRSGDGGGGGAAVDVMLEALLRYHNIRPHLLRRPVTLLPGQDSVRSISTQHWEWLTWVSI